MLDAENFKRRIRKEIAYNVEWLSNVKPEDIIRIFHNLMDIGVVHILLGRELLNHFEKYEPAIRETVKDYTKFAFELEDNHITFRTTGQGYRIGSVALIETKPRILQIDEDFSIKGFREYVKKIIDEQ